MASNPATAMARPPTQQATDGVGDLRLRHRGPASIAAFAVIERHLFALRLDWNGPTVVSRKRVALAECAGVQQLGDGERSVRLDSADDRLQAFACASSVMPG